MQKDILKAFKKLYPFSLDEFQIKAAKSLIKGNSVLVTAPTGAGKTVIAEFAIFDSLDRDLSTIYTTPLKALSNQKYRDFCDQYGPSHVGLLTGDVAINAFAPIIVMTTEILRNIMYQDMSRLDKVAYVVLDECHYMNDIERGTVWEESIIHCPKHIQILALSATVNNAKDLALWISSINNKVDLIEHHIRPVPLKPFYYTGKKIHPIFDEEGNPNSQLLKKKYERLSYRDYQKRLDELRPSNVVRELDDKNLLPAIYFIFSRRSCDSSLNDCMIQKVNLVTKQERDDISEIIEKTLKSNPSLTQTSANTNHILNALKRGIAIHHAGLVPALKYLVEILFQRNLVKVVFATETLAAGINMPARTTVISTLSKKSDNGYRMLTSNAFTQMTGRAGRRGKDEIGYCVILDDGKYPFSELVRLIQSDPDPIISNFTISYNMVLNLLKNFDLDNVSRLLKKSFGQYNSGREIIDLQINYEKKKKKLEKLLMPCEYKPDLPHEEVPLLEYENKKAAIRKQEYRVREFQETLENKHYKKALVDLVHAPNGAIVIIKTSEDSVPILGILSSRYTRGKDFFGIIHSNKGVAKITPNECLYVFKETKKIEIHNKILLKISSDKKIGKWLTDKRLRKPFTAKENKEYLGKISEELYPKAFADELEKLDFLRDELLKHECSSCPILNEHLDSYKSFKNLILQVNLIKDKIEEQKESYITDFKKFMNVLFHYKQLQQDPIDNKYKPTEGGHLTSYIRSEYDLAIALVINEGILDELKPIEIASVLSIFIYESRKAIKVDLRDFPKRIKASLQRIDEIIKKLEYRQAIEGIDKKLELELEMVPIVYLWGNGCSWKKLFENKKLDDGDIVRTMRRLIDLLHQIKNIPTISFELRSKMEEAIVALDRDLITVSVEEHEDSTDEPLRPPIDDV